MRTRRIDWSTLGVPLDARGPTWVAVAIVGAVSLLTMSRDLSWYDSAEFALVTAQGGLSHPPGHPFYTMLGWLVSHIPGVPPLLGLNALSALPASLAVIPATSLAEALAGLKVKAGSSDSKLRWLLPMAVATFTLHPVLWETASRVEVYALAGFLALWSTARLAAALTAEAGRTRDWLAAGLGFGLCAATNPMVAMVTALSLAPAVIVALKKRIAEWTQGLSLVAGGVLGLVPPMFWIPLVAGRADAFVWGAPTGGEPLRRYLSGADFTGKKEGMTWIIMGDHALEWLEWTLSEALLPLLLLGLAAHIIWGQRAGLGRGALAIGLTLTVAFLTTNAFFAPEIPDYLGYQMVPFMLCSAAVAALIAHLGAEKGRKRTLAVVLGVALVLSILSAAPSPWVRTRYRDHFARTLARGALHHAPPQAIAIGGSDHWVFPMLYIQEVEGMRSDVVVLPRGLSGASWYWEHLHRRHPSLERFPLRGSGGQPARIRRFLAANPDRPVVYEDWTQATSIGRRPGCLGPWWLHDEVTCSSDRAPRLGDDELTTDLARALRDLGSGSPGTDAVIANVSFHRGEILWRLGHPARALRAFRAGVPVDRRPTLADEAAALSDDVAPPRALPRWRERPALGHFSQNLFVAGLLLMRAGKSDAAVAHFAAAAAAGLPEALVLLEHARSRQQ